MTYAEVPWTPEIARAVEVEWALSAGAVERLTGGEESAAYRMDTGGVVVRIGPVSRGSELMEWCHQVAAAAGVDEVMVPLRTTSGASVVRVAGRPVSVWPLVAGRWLDNDEPAEVEQAARLLARLHYGLRDVALPVRPEPSYLEATTGVLPDEELDRWLGAFSRRRQPLHGDYYRGNLLVDRGRITGLIDWDEAWVGAPEVELAGAAREFGEHWSTDLTRAKQLVAWYHDEGGTAGELDDETLVQLIRHRLRAEVTAFGGEDDDEYYGLLRELFGKLRP
ncbi:phosphotransferase [Kribbella sp. NPDC051770]|uniref:phosphotransferase enzyme family protein n=1 Tax=Kribbella sp. NPDC051770 TaxID=3155413 RepID=UPI003438EC2D